MMYLDNTHLNDAKLKASVLLLLFFVGIASCWWLANAYK